MAHNETRRAEKGTSSRELRKSMLETHLKHDRNRVLRRLESYENEIITKEIRYLFTLTGRSEDQHKLYTKCVEPKPEFNLIPDGWKTFWAWVEDEQARQSRLFLAEMKKNKASLKNEWKLADFLLDGWKQFWHKVEKSMEKEMKEVEDRNSRLRLAKLKSEQKEADKLLAELPACWKQVEKWKRDEKESCVQ